MTATKHDIQKDENINTNSTSSVTTALRLDDATHAGLFVKSKTGVHSSHVITLELSPDDGTPTNWFTTSHSVTGEGQIHEDLCIAYWVRAKVTTAEGATSTVDVTIVIK